MFAEICDRIRRKEDRRLVYIGPHTSGRDMLYAEVIEEIPGFVYPCPPEWRTNYRQNGEGSRTSHIENEPACEANVAAQEEDYDTEIKVEGQAIPSDPDIINGKPFMNMRRRRRG
jgi:hypothetical protein